MRDGHVGLIGGACGNGRVGRNSVDVCYAIRQDIVVEHGCKIGRDMGGRKMGREVEGRVPRTCRIFLSCGDESFPCHVRDRFFSF